MKKPYILALDDDTSVLRAVERGLKAKFTGAYRVLAADTPEKALEYVRQLTARGDQIALFLVDQRMPLMSGVEFLQEARLAPPPLTGGGIGCRESNQPVSLSIIGARDHTFYGLSP